MRQRYIEDSRIYTKLKNIVIDNISKSNFESSLSNINLTHVCFDHFVNDDAREANTFDTLLKFLLFIISHDSFEHV